MTGRGRARALAGRRGGWMVDLEDRCVRRCALGRHAAARTGRGQEDEAAGPTSAASLRLVTRYAHPRQLHSARIDDTLS